MRILLAVLLLLLLLLQYQLWLGEGGFANVRRLEQRVSEQAAENVLLEQRNQELRAEVEDLRQGYDAIEERARSELGMIREDEEFYQVVPDPGPEPVAEPASGSEPEPESAPKPESFVQPQHESEPGE